MPNQFFSPEGDLETYFVTEYWLIDQYVGDELWGWGANFDQGQLGVNDNNTRFSPVTTFAGGTNWKQVAGGRDHTVAVKTDGTLWGWGRNNSGQLGGNNTSTGRFTPITTFAGGTDWKQVSCGGFHTLAIKTNGTLWTWGANTYGRLGNNSVSNVQTPVTTFSGGTNWRQVSGSHADFTAAIKTDGTLWIWGRDSNGQLGNNSGGGSNRSVPITTFAGGTNWKQVSCGVIHAAAIKTDGTLWAWGSNNYGQIGNNTTAFASFTPVTTFAGGTDWKQVSCGGYFTAAIKTNGTLWTWGRNPEIQLGNNATGNRSTPVTTFAGGTNWKQVSCGRQHTTAIKTDGTLWAWGRGTSGQLADNLGANKSTPITTFAGGTNWKQVSGSCGYFTVAVFSGTTPDLPIS